MATTQCLLMYVATTLLTSLPAAFVASVVFEAGNSSFTPLQESSFWTSDGGNYTFGFQVVNGGDDYLLSIWHSGDPSKTAIWWPLGSNAVDHDPTIKADAIFNFTSNGSLELQSPSGSLFWSTKTASSYAELRDSGNLVLFDNVSSAIPTWQSFEDSRNSLMLAEVSTIAVANKPHLLQSKRNQSLYSTGRFSLRTDADKNVELHGIDRLGNDFIYVHGHMHTSATEEFWVRKDGTIYDDNTLNELKRLTLDYDGNLRIYQWESSRSSWSSVWQILDDMCWVGSPCGPFGICETEDADGKANCSCPPSYQTIVAEDPSQGCESSISFNASCGLLPAENDYMTTMVEVPNMDYDYNDLENLTGVSIETCKQRCLSRCADCMASGYKQVGGLCYIKGTISTGYLMNGYLASDSTLLIKVVTRMEPKKDRTLVRGVGVAATMLVVGCSAFVLWRRRDDAKRLIALLQPRGGKNMAGDVGPLRFYRHDELVVATRNFSEKLGEGGFATVFKGWVKVENRGFDNTGTEDEIGSNTDDNQQLQAVAVKVLKSLGDEKVDDAFRKSYSQYKSEISTLGKIHHVNLVSLLGYSYSTTGVLNHRKVQRLLVYECMEKGSLDTYLSTTRSTNQKLPWATRYSIALGTARGITYLHHDCNPPTLHCDIKPHNILLDAHFTAKVADFGFARRFHLHRSSNSHIIMSAVRGTRGYLAPEWLRSDEITFKADVYSFGTVLLELVRGFRTDDDLHMPLVEWGNQCISEGVVMDFSQHLDGNVGDIHIDEAPSEGVVTEFPRHFDGNVGDIHIDDAPSENSQDGPQEADEKLRLLKVGMWCIQHKPTMRPSMLQVVQLIEGTITMEDPPNPSLPPFFPSFLSNSSFPSHYTYSNVSAR